MTVQITKKVSNGREYNNIKIADVGFGETVTLRLKFEGAYKNPDGTYPKGKFTDLRTGAAKDVYNYSVELIEPALGDVSFYAPAHLQHDLSAYKKGDVLKITPVEKKTQKGTLYKGYKLEKVELAMSPEDKQTIMQAIKALPKKPSEETIKQMLRQFGFTKEADIQEILRSL